MEFQKKSNILERFFQTRQHKTTIKNEIVAGLTTFSTIAYAMVVVPLILQNAGLSFKECLAATLLTGAIATLMMGILANYPFVFFPGMGIGAYFTYSIVIENHLPWQTALGLTFLVGLLMVVLWVTRLRELIIHAIPLGLKIGTTAGIGLFLVLIALKNMNLVIFNSQTLIGAGNLVAPQSLLFGFELALIAALMAKGVRGAILIGVFVSWVLGLAFGFVQWKGVVALPEFSMKAFLALDIKSAFSFDCIFLVFSFLMVYLFDTSGALMGLAHQGAFFDKDGNLPRFRRALLPDTLGTLCASLLGTSPTVPYVESAAGMAAGGRTGLTSTVVGLLFLASLFFAPLVASIPFFAVAPVLVIVGALMLRSVIDFRWKDPSDFIPCYVTVVAIPYLFSIGNGIGLGMILYPVCKLLCGKWREVHPFAWILALLFAVKFGFMRG